MCINSRISIVPIAIATAVLVSACGHVSLPLPDKIGLAEHKEKKPPYVLDERVETPEMFSKWPAERLVAYGKRAYRKGNYGLAVKAYEKAVQIESKNAEAWLGLAASYDQLKRFDLAKRSYDVVVRLVGHTPTVLNNLGYHYHLAGKPASARRMLVAAAEAEPDNTVIQNNLEIVESPPGAKPKL
ncbi:MAG: tetratricopeptide repeat protein [Pseudomonadota bacterium]